VDAVALEIGGICISIQSAHAEVLRLVQARYAGFLSHATPAWRIQVGTRPGGRTSLVDVVVRGDGEGGRLELERHDFVATIDLRERWATVALAEIDEIPLDSFLRVAFSLILLAADGLVVHAASLARGGRGYLFPGRSGSGKTTLARLSPQARLLSDELSIVRLVERRALCYGTPFWGELARGGENLAVPMRSIHFLRQSDRHAVRPLVPRGALAALLPNVVFFARAPDLVARVFAVAAGLVERVPCFQLSFRRDPGFWEVVEHA